MQSMALATITRLWPTLAAGLLAALGGISSDPNFLTQHPRATIWISVAIMILGNFTHSPAGPRATPTAIMAATPAPPEVK